MLNRLKWEAAWSLSTPGFTNEVALTPNESYPGGPPTFNRVQSASGNWQMFPRDDTAVSVIQDGRWKLPPNPVDWAIRPRFAQPLAVRRDLGSNPSALVLARSDECFALAMPHETEAHCSLYLCQFGRDLKAGETARARARLVILDSLEESRFLEESAKFASK